MATQSNILAWEIPWIEEPGGLQYTGSHRVGHNLKTTQHNLIIAGNQRAIPLCVFN